MGLQIEKGIPYPARNGGNGNRKFPWPDLEVGDSVHIPFDREPFKVRSVISNSLAAYKLRNAGWNYRTQRDETGVRVWRVA